MGTEKEVAAFVERIGKRVSESPRPRRRERNRAAFIALRQFIVGALASGYTIKTIWATLRDEKKLAMSYQTFRTHCRRAGVVLKSEAAGPGLSRSGTAPAQGRPATSADLAPREFRHERVPRKKDIYG
jgi:hypothetical protein